MNQNTTKNSRVGGSGHVTLTAEILDEKLAGKQALLETLEQLGQAVGRYAWKLGSRVQRISARLARMEEEEVAAYQARKQAKMEARARQAGTSFEQFLAEAAQDSYELQYQLRQEVGA